MTIKGTVHLKNSCVSAKALKLLKGVKVPGVSGMKRWEEKKNNKKNLNHIQYITTNVYVKTKFIPSLKSH